MSSCIFAASWLFKTCRLDGENVVSDAFIRCRYERLGRRRICRWRRKQ